MLALPDIHQMQIVASPQTDLLCHLADYAAACGLHMQSYVELYKLCTHPQSCLSLLWVDLTEHQSVQNLWPPKPWFCCQEAVCQSL